MWAELDKDAPPPYRIQSWLPTERETAKILTNFLLGLATRITVEVVDTLIVVAVSSVKLTD